MRERIQQFMDGYVRDAAARLGVSGEQWGDPLIGYADAGSPAMGKLREIAAPDHRMPREVLASATVVLVYFLPIGKEIANSNRAHGLASPAWAQTYEQTNALFAELNAALCRLFAAWGHVGIVPPEATAFDADLLRAKWSQRHLARLAGLGNFGLNNMLITHKGCCGRISSIVTDLPIAPDACETREFCRYKQNGRCAACVSRCPSGALTQREYDRRACYAVCRENAAVYTQFGNSYAAAPGEAILASGSEVCGKCVVGLPCTFAGSPPKPDNAW